MDKVAALIGAFIASFVIAAARPSVPDRNRQAFPSPSPGTGITPYTVPVTAPPAATTAEPSGTTALFPSKAERLVVGELEFLADALTAAKKRGWNGRTPIPVTAADFSADQLSRYRSYDQRRSKALTIPETVSEYFLTPAAGSGITAELPVLYGEFMAYLKARGVKAAYITELTGHTLPMTDDRVTYHPVNDPDAPPTAVTYTRPDGHADYSRLRLDVYAVDVYNFTDTVVKSGILGNASRVTATPELYRRARSIGLRQLLYHELMHALQRTYESVNAKPAERTGKSAWVSNPVPLWKSDPSLFAYWGPSDVINAMNNHRGAGESQADAVSYDLVTRTYAMDEMRRGIWWDYNFGMLETARATYDRINDMFKSDFPSYTVDAIGTELDKAVVSGIGDPATKTVLRRYANRLGDIAAYNGYFHTMTPVQLDRMWTLLR